MLVPGVYRRLLKRGRVRLSRTVVLEPKYDGVLLVATPRGYYNILGWRAPRYLLEGLKKSGYAESVKEMRRDGFTVFIEVFGRRLTPNGYHMRYARDYDIRVIDVGFEDYTGRLRILPPEKAVDAASLYSLPFVEYRYEDSTVLTEPPASMAVALPSFKGWEGYVAKLYSAHGHQLPPDYEARTRGVLMVKARWASLGSLVA